MCFQLAILSLLGIFCCASSLGDFNSSDYIAVNHVVFSASEQGAFGNASTESDLPPRFPIDAEINHYERSLKQDNGNAICAVTELYCGSTYTFFADTRLALDGKQCTLDAGQPNLV